MNGVDYKCGQATSLQSLWSVNGLYPV